MLYSDADRGAPRLPQDSRLVAVAATSVAANAARPARLPPNEVVEGLPQQTFTVAGSRTGSLGGWGDTLSGMQWCVLSIVLRISCALP